MSILVVKNPLLVQDNAKDETPTATTDNNANKKEFNLSPSLTDGNRTNIENEKKNNKSSNKDKSNKYKWSILILVALALIGIVVTCAVVFLPPNQQRIVETVGETNKESNNKSEKETLSPRSIPTSTPTISLEEMGNAQASIRPSFLMIIADDLRLDKSLYEGEDQSRFPYKTPNIARIAKSGMMFYNAHSQMASCGPSRASFLTGRRNDALQVWNLLANWRVKGTAPRSFPQFLKQNGYTTIALGKVFHWDDEAESDPLSWTNEYLTNPTVDPKCVTGSYFCPCPSDGCIDAKIAATAISKFPDLRRQHYQGNPFFMAIGFRRPHLDWRLPSNYVPQNLINATKSIPLAKVKTLPSSIPDVTFYACQQLLGRGQGNSESILPSVSLSDSLASQIRTYYWGAVKYVDEQIGRVLDALEANNLSSQTIVIMTSDHGWSLGERGMWCKQNNFDVATRVPLIIRVPWLQDKIGGVKNYRPVEMMDLYPTVTDIIGLSFPDNCVQGKSFKSYLFGTDDDADARYLIKDYAISEFPRCFSSASKTNPYDDPCMKNDGSDFDYMGYSIRTKDWRYTEWRLWNKVSLKVESWTDDSPNILRGVELYDHRSDKDLNNDDFETVNLAGVYPPNSDIGKIEDALRKKLRSIVSGTQFSQTQCGQTANPTKVPTTKAPTFVPTFTPTLKPATFSPTTKSPTIIAPTTRNPTSDPTGPKTSKPSNIPTKKPTKSPNAIPTEIDSAAPTSQPVSPTPYPSKTPRPTKIKTPTLSPSPWSSSTPTSTGNAAEINAYCATIDKRNCDNTIYKGVPCVFYSGYGCVGKGKFCGFTTRKRVSDIIPGCLTLRKVCMWRKKQCYGRPKNDALPRFTD